MLATRQAVRQTPDRPQQKVILTEALVREQQTRVWRYLRFLGCPPPLADDLTQESFLAILESPPEDRGADALGAWLRGVARNLVRVQRRQLRKGFDVLSEEELELAFLRYVQTDDGDGYHDALRACMDSLEEKEQLAIRLRYEEDASREAIAKQADVSKEGAKTLLRRAKDKLRLCIRGRIGHEQA